MKVKELIAKLQKMPQDQEVYWFESKRGETAVADAMQGYFHLGLYENGKLKYHSYDDFPKATAAVGLLGPNFFEESDNSDSAPVTIDARDDSDKMLDEYKSLAAKVKKLTKQVSKLEERVQSLESHRDAEESYQMERRERGYE